VFFSKRSKEEEQKQPMRELTSQRKRSFAPRPVVTGLEFIEIKNFFIGGEMHSDQVSSDRVITMMTRLKGLDTSQIRSLMSEILKLDDKDRSKDQVEAVAFAIVELAKEDAETAVNFLTENATVMTNWNMMSPTILKVVAIWQHQDVDAASHWINQQIISKKEIIDWDTLSMLPSCLVASSPEKAFEAAIKLRKLPKPVDIVAFGSSITSDEQRSRLVGYLRENSNHAELQGLLDDAWSGIADGLLRQPTQKALEWIDHSSLQKDERLRIVNGILAGKQEQSWNLWCEWIAKYSSEQEMAQVYDRMIIKWSEKNHRDVAAYVSNLTDQNTQIMAMQAFAVAVCKIDPEAAEAWTNALPTEELRSTTKQRIYIKTQW
jgi:hypothetical protein